MRKIFLAIAAALVLVGPALADWTGKNATPATITFKNPNDCTSVACVPVAQLYDGTNVVTLTTAGADGVSNTLTGVPVYNRLQFYNGTTWDRARGDTTSGLWVNVKNANTNGSATSANSSPVVIASDQAAVAVKTASGAIASGSVASGAFASGSIASGAIAAGAQVDLLTMRGSLAAGTAAANSIAVGGVFNSTPPTLTNGQQSAAQFDANGFLKVRPSDGTKTAALDPCEANAQSYSNGVITSATTTRIITPSASNKTYVCAMLLTASAADNVGVVEGTGGTCGTGTAGVVGGTTAANGLNFATNGGVMMQAGGKVAVAQTAGTNVDFCLITSSAGPLTYSVKYVQAP